MINTLSVNNSAQSLTVRAWNARGINTGATYLTHLLDKCDVMIVSEHWLPSHELFKLNYMHDDFTATAKAGKNTSSVATHAWGGVAILWRKSIDLHVSVIDVPSRRICVIKLYQKHCIDLYIVGVYLPQTGCKNENFMDELILLEELIANYNTCGDLIIMGDMNCHYSFDVGPRGWGKTTAQAKLLLQAAKRNGLVFADLQAVCTGPMFTYDVEGVGRSYIDHCLVNRRLYNQIQKCYVIDDNVINTSDHLPVCVQIHVSTSFKRTPSCKKCDIAWYKLDSLAIETEYTNTVNNQMSILLEKWSVFPHELEMDVSQVNGKVGVDSMLHAVTEVMQTCSQNLPRKGYNKALKPYWTCSLKSLSKRKRHIYSIWQKAGCPRNCDNVIWTEYKYVKKLFRKEQRIAIREFEVKNMKQLIEHSEIDSAYFWYLVNISRKTYTKQITPLLVDNNLLSEVSEVKSAWASYFEDMFTPSKDRVFDDNWFHHVNESVVKEFENSRCYAPTVLAQSFTLNEVVECLNKTKNKKATGWDDVSAEHVKYGGTILHKCILYIFNYMLHFEDMPKSLKKGVLVTIPKGKSDPAIRENNRGLTLLPFLNKLYQILLKDRLGCSKSTVIHPIQGAGRKKVSCLHTSMLLRETVSYNIEKNKDVVVSFLDVQKAFDRVWINGMLYKLFKSGLDPKFCRIVKNMYDDFYCCVRVMDQYTHWFAVAQGVQQGASLSLFLYQVFMNDLIEQLIETKLGADIDGIPITCPSFADDMALVTTSTAKMQCLLDIAYQHSRTWRYKYNAAKSEVLCFYKKKANVCFMLGKEIIPIRDKCKHLGTVMTNKPKHVREFFSEKVYKGKQILMAVHGLGNRQQPVHTSVMAKVYWSLCIPVITYGCEVLPVDDTTRLLFDSSHVSVAKQIQCLPRHTPNPCVLPQLGWSTLYGYVELIKLLFLWRILQMDTMSVYKMIVIKRVLHYLKSGSEISGPICDCLRVARKYNVLQCIVNSILNGSYMSMPSWKALVKEKINTLEAQAHVITHTMYKKSNLFMKCIKPGEVWPWYIHSSRNPELTRLCTTLLRIIIGVELENDVYKGENVCMCSPDCRATVAHVIFVCPLLTDKRQFLWQNVSRLGPKILIDGINNMPAEERICFLFSGFNCKYLPEWSQLYTGVISFICEMVEMHKTRVQANM